MAIDTKEFTVYAVITCITIDKTTKFSVGADVTDEEYEVLTALEPGTSLEAIDERLDHFYDDISTQLIEIGMADLYETYPELEEIDHPEFMIELYA